MRPFILITLTALLFQAAGHAQNEAAAPRLLFDKAGFSIAPLQVDPVGLYTPLVMSLPAEDGFAANINVMIQPYLGTMPEYIELSRTQVKGLNLEILQVKQPSPDEAIFEYAGMMQNNKLHWYSRAIKKGPHVYLATATCLEAKWAAQSPRLIPCVDSLKLP